MKLSSIAHGLAMLALGGCTEAVAQNPPNEMSAARPPVDVSAGEGDGNVVSYPAPFFANARPNTALDMIRQTPGFSFNRGDQNVRGLSGAGGNVLIDGQPQTSKAVTLEDVLARIPANQVERIDIVRGGAGGIDMQGQSVVANVIRKKGAEPQSAAQIDGRVFSDSDDVDLGARFEWSRRVGDLALDGAAEAGQRRQDNGGDGLLIRRDGAGAPLDSGDYLVDNAVRSAALNAGGEYRAGATLYRGSLGFDYRKEARDERSVLAVPEQFLSDTSTSKIELGGNIERTLSPSMTLRLDVLQTLEDETRAAGRAGATNTTDTRAGESIARASVSVRSSPALGVETGAEGAFNFLDQESTLTFANANVLVKEVRAQPFVTLNWQALAPLALEFGARYESSTISQSGDTDSERSFYYLKPRVIAALTVSDATRLRGRIERDVKQLDFGDFTASSGMNDNTAAAGNAALRPEWAWVYEAAIEQRLWESSTLVLTVTHEAVHDLIDYIQVGQASDGRGNIGRGSRDTIDLNLKAALDRFGLPGGRIEVSPTYISSEVADPFTGETRDISGNQQWRGRINVYLDRPEINTNFGFEAMIGYRYRSWRRSQITTNVQPFFYTAWAEWRPAPTWSVRTTADFIGVRTNRRDRIVFAGARPAAAPSFLESRVYKREPALQVRVRKTF